MPLIQHLDDPIMPLTQNLDDPCSRRSAWIGGVPSTSKTPASMDVLQGLRKPSLEPKTICHLIRMPREIRDKIYKELFYLPVGVVPFGPDKGYCPTMRYLDSLYRGAYLGCFPSPYDHNQSYIHYGSRYLFDAMLADGSEESDSGRTTPERSKNLVQVVQVTKPNTEEHRLRELDEHYELPRVIDGESGHVTTREFFEENGNLRIINCTSMVVERLGGIALLRTCMMIHDEATEILYGRNTFVFDTRGLAAAKSDWVQEDYHEFSALEHHVPGLPRRDGTIATEKQTTANVAHLFNRSSYKLRYCHEDPLMRFAYEVGPRNMSLIKKVKIEGYLQISPPDNNEFCAHIPYGLARVFPIYVAVLSRACPSLHDLTLHMGSDTTPILTSPFYDRDQTSFGDFILDTADDTWETSSLSIQAKVDHMVQAVVGGISSLQRLQLGDYKTAEINGADIRWGDSVRWVEFVEARAKVTENDRMTDSRLAKSQELVRHFIESYEKNEKLALLNTESLTDGKFGTAYKLPENGYGDQLQDRKARAELRKNKAAAKNVGVVSHCRERESEPY